MSEVQTTPRRETLFSIEAELLGLLDQREDAEQRHSEAKDMRLILEIEQELKVIEGLIRDYVKAEVRKVDGCAFAIKEFEARAAARSQEAERMKASADRDAETAKRIKAMVLEVMQEFDEKKLPGRLFTISRQGNGGVQALTIAQPDLIPLEFKRVTVELRADVCREFVDKFAGKYRILEIVHPDKEDIREVLETSQKQRQAILKAAEVSGVSITDERVARDLSALPGVPGCRLEPRGEQIRIR